MLKVFRNVVPYEHMRAATHRCVEKRTFLAHTGRLEQCNEEEFNSSIHEAKAFVLSIGLPENKLTHFKIAIATRKVS